VACSGIDMDLACHFALQCGISFVKCKFKSADIARPPKNASRFSGSQGQVEDPGL